MTVHLMIIYFKISNNTGRLYLNCFLISLLEYTIKRIQKNQEGLEMGNIIIYQGGDQYT
jgi:hypothetical protein